MLSTNVCWVEKRTWVVIRPSKMKASDPAYFYKKLHSVHIRALQNSPHCEISQLLSRKILTTCRRLAPVQQAEATSRDRKKRKKSRRKEEPAHKAELNNAHRI
jgi:hypothetical protein